MRLVGIDPGMTGALALFDGGRLEWVADMPCFDGRVDGIELTSQLDCMVDVVYLENTHPMPKNGSIASFKLGLNTGIVIGVVQAMAIPLYRISTAVWKNYNGLRGKPKNASIGLARELFPHMASEFRRVRDDGRAEAALIGRYGVYSHIHQTKTGEEHNEQGVAPVSDLRGRDRHPSGSHARAVDRPAHGAVTSTTEGD